MNKAISLALLSVTPVVLQGDISRYPVQGPLVLKKQLGDFSCGGRTIAGMVEVEVSLSMQGVC